MPALLSPLQRSGTKKPHSVPPESAVPPRIAVNKKWLAGLFDTRSTNAVNKKWLAELFETRSPIVVNKRWLAKLFETRNKT